MPANQTRFFSLSASVSAKPGNGRYFSISLFFSLFPPPSVCLFDGQYVYVYVCLCVVSAQAKFTIDLSITIANRSKICGSTMSALSVSVVSAFSLSFCVYVYVSFQLFVRSFICSSVC